MKKTDRTFFVLLQLVGALIWGLAFAFQSIGMEETGPFTFTASRFVLAALAVFIFSIFRDKAAGKRQPEAPGAVNRSWRSGTLWKAGILCGILLSIASNLQQIGILYTYSVGKAGFITAMYIVIVPLLGLFMKKKVGLPVWIGVVTAVVGLYFLSVSEKMSFEKGDPFLMACAVMFSLQILAIDRYSGEIDGVKLACVEFLTVSVTSAFPMFILEKPSFTSIVAAAIPILYAGVMSGGIAYTIQIICQTRLEPYTASILMSCEALFSVLGGFMILHQRLTVREIIGCVLMFAAIMIVQIFPGRAPEKEHK